MNIPWRSQGISAFHPFQFPSNYRDYISGELKELGIDNIPQQCWKDLESAISIYHSEVSIKASSKPSDARANLKALTKASLVLESRIEELDSNSMMFLRIALRKSCSQFLNDELRPFILACQEAENQADLLPKRGSLKDEAKLELATAVALSITNHLERKPTATIGGLYDELLIMVLEIATEQEVKSAHALTERVLTEKL